MEALEHWPREGIPERPGAWLLTTARRKGLDRLRREARYQEKLQLLATVSAPPSREADDRLRLIFTCCHPALAPEAQMALTLRLLGGFYLINAKDLNEAIQVASKIPSARFGEVEIRPVVEFNQQ